MAKKRNFLFGKGERLLEPMIPSRKVVDRELPYTPDEAKRRLAPMLREVVEIFDGLPSVVCPNDETVSSVVLNPEYLAKSYFPENLLRSYGLRAVGSKSKTVIPDQRSKGRSPEEKLTTELFVAGLRKSFKQFYRDLISENSDNTPERNDLGALEQISFLKADQKIKGEFTDQEAMPLEVVLHAKEFKSDGYILSGFAEYVDSLNLEIDLDKRIFAGGLCFLRLYASREEMGKLAQFTFLRTVRKMPRLRRISGLSRSASASVRPTSVVPTFILPDQPALDRNIRVAIFDGGLPPNSPLAPWVTAYDGPGVGAAVQDLLAHGQEVTSAALFGHIRPESGSPLARPFAKIDHYRVLDSDSDDQINLPDVADRIKSILESGSSYDFINLSIGPELPVDDDDVHSWTAILDECLSGGNTLATVAVGNSGGLDSTYGLNRVQVPADCVNGLAVGACNSYSTTWQRAEYSAIGPGRSPGVVRPAVLAFGGCGEEPYGVVSSTEGQVINSTGTSLAAPHVMRMGVAMRALMGSSLTALGTQALLIHAAETGNHSQAEVGWGRVPDNLDDLLVCSPGIIRVIYQGELTASKYIRARIPLPPGEIRGLVSITGTCCFATPVDPAHPSLYTRSGVEIAFRPNQDVFERSESINPKSTAFFSQSLLYQTETRLRTDAHKWETTLHSKKRLRSSSLNNPCFDLHYISRDEGHSDRVSHKMKYALVISVEAPAHKDLYDRVLVSYRNILEPLVPQIDIEVDV